MRAAVEQPHDTDGNPGMQFASGYDCLQGGMGRKSDLIGQGWIFIGWNA
jgi:hypothetical protein